MHNSSGDTGECFLVRKFHCLNANDTFCLAGNSIQRNWSMIRNMGTVYVLSFRDDEIYRKPYSFSTTCLSLLIRYIVGSNWNLYHFSTVPRTFAARLETKPAVYFIKSLNAPLTSYPYFKWSTAFRKRPLWDCAFLWISSIPYYLKSVRLLHTYLLQFIFISRRLQVRVQTVLSCNTQNYRESEKGDLAMIWNNYWIPVFSLQRQTFLTTKVCKHQKSMAMTFFR